MAFLIGTDEAGYGPNLGPLVVTATVWELPDRLLHRDLYPVLKCGITPAAPEEDDARVWLGDSKQLYKPGAGLAGLERGVLAALAVSEGVMPASWQRLLCMVDPQGSSDARRLPWYEQFDEPLPVDSSGADIASAVAQLGSSLSAAQMRLCKVRSALVFEDYFNELLGSCGNKSSALSKVTLDLVQPLVDELGGPLLIRCDKHGGRNRYGPLLQQRFPDSLVMVRQEGRAESRYQLVAAAGRIEFRFTAKGDRHLPAALASMVSKYLRELAMRGFNAFWSDHVAQLRPTAGYPTDARRFKKDIASAQSRLGIADDLLWRAR